MSFFEETLTSEYFYKGKIINLRRDTVRLSSGSEAVREVCEHHGAVSILPVLDSGEVVLVSQFRYPMKKELLEVPAGKLEIGEEPRSCAERELSEETGLSAKKIVELGCVYPSPGYLTEKIHLYLAIGAVEGEAHPDEGEELSVVRMKLSDAVAMCDRGEISDLKTIALIYRADRYLKGEDNNG